MAAGGGGVEGPAKNEAAEILVGEVSFTGPKVGCDSGTEVTGTGGLTVGNLRGGPVEALKEATFGKLMGSEVASVVTEVTGTGGLTVGNASGGPSLNLKAGF